MLAATLTLLLLLLSSTLLMGLPTSVNHFCLPRLSVHTCSLLVLQLLHSVGCYTYSLMPDDDGDDPLTC
jgi:hypothetical protein